jgi:hypothetical protein
VVWRVGETPVILREFNRVVFTNQRYLMVLPMFVGAVVALVAGSLMTAPPSRWTLARYFDDVEPGEPPVPPTPKRGFEVRVGQDYDRP